MSLPERPCCGVPMDHECSKSCYTHNLTATALLKINQERCDFLLAWLRASDHHKIVRQQSFKHPFAFTVRGRTIAEGQFIDALDAVRNIPQLAT